MSRFKNVSVRVFILVTTSRDLNYRRGIHARFIVSSLMISRSIRRDSISCIYVRDIRRVLIFYGSTIRQLRADEASAYGIINKALKSRSRRPHSGVVVEDDVDIQDIVKKFRTDKYLIKSSIGHDIENVLRGVKSITYITYISQNIEDFYDRFERVRFLRNLKPEQEVAIINILLDRYC